MEDVSRFSVAMHMFECGPYIVKSSLASLPAAAAGNDGVIGQNGNTTTIQLPITYYINKTNKTKKKIIIQSYALANFVDRTLLIVGVSTNLKHLNVF